MNQQLKAFFKKKRALHAVRTLQSPPPRQFSGQDTAQQMQSSALANEWWVPRRAVSRPEPPDQPPVRIPRQQHQLLAERPHLHI